MMRTLAIRVAASVLACCSLQAATYYVSTNGSDTAVGTVSQPWLTIQKAANTAVAGDAIQVLPGLYPERVKISKASGRSGSPITFSGNGSATNYGFAISSSFVTIDGFDIPGNTNTANWDASIWVNRGLQGITLINNRIHDFDAINQKVFGVYFYYATNAAACTRDVVVSNNVFLNLSQIMLNIYASNAIVCNNVFNFANSHDAMHPFGAYITISDNLFTNISANPLVPDHTDIVQTYGDDPADAYNIVFERNLVVNCQAQLCQLEQKGREGIRDWVFRNNVWVNLSMNANCDVQNVQWYNNTFYRCKGSVLLNCNAKGCSLDGKIYNNIFSECGPDPSNNQFGWYQPENTNFTYYADYNFVCGSGGAPKGVSPPNSMFKWGSWGQELHGINGGDPGFIDAAHYDFRLRPDSKLIYAGTNLTSFGFSDDLQRARRPVSSPWSLGAYQYGLSDVQTPRPPSSLRRL